MKTPNIKLIYVAIVFAIMATFPLVASAQEVETNKITITETARVLHTYTGAATGAGLTASNWDTGLTPTNTSQTVFGWRDQVSPTEVTEYYTNIVTFADILVDARPEQNSYVTFSLPVANMASGMAKINVGDTMKFDRTANGNLNWTLEALDNSGTVIVSAGTPDANSRTYNMIFTTPYAVTNRAGGLINIHNGSGRTTIVQQLQMNVRNRNDGEYLISNTPQQVSNGAILRLENSGVFENNGIIRVLTTGNSVNGTSYSRLTFASAENYIYSAFEGNGKLVFEMRQWTRSHSPIAQATFSSTTHIITNGISHTIEGEGLMNPCNLINDGLVLANGANDRLEIRSDSMWNQNTSSLRSALKRIQNNADGRFVCSSTNGLLLGTDSALANRPSRFLNYGLMESRTGCFIAFRPNVTHSDNWQQVEPPVNILLSGTWAGGGAFRIPRPLQLDGNAVVSPGDLYADDGFGGAITNGTGVSTAGVLTFTNSLILSASTQVNVQLGSPSERGVTYDGIDVGGDFTLDGILNISDLGGRIHNGEYVIFKWPTTRNFTDKGLAIGTLPNGWKKAIVELDNLAGELRVIVPPQETLLIIK